MQIFAHTPEYHVRCLRAKISTAEECSELKEKEGWLVQRGAMALAKPHAGAPASVILHVSGKKTEAAVFRESVNGRRSRDKHRTRRRTQRIFLKVYRRERMRPRLFR